MKRNFSALLLGVVIASTGVSYASASWIDNVPARFRPGATQNQFRASNPTDDGMVTGSVDRAPARTGQSLRSNRAGKP